MYYVIIMCFWIKGVGEGREVAVFLLWCDAGLRIMHYFITKFGHDLL